MILPVGHLDQVGALGLYLWAVRLRARFVPLAVAVGNHIKRHHAAERLARAIFERDRLAVVRIDHQLQLLPCQFIGHLKALPLVTHGAVLAYLAREPVVEQFIQPLSPVAEAADTG